MSALLIESEFALEKHDCWTHVLSRTKGVLNNISKVGGGIHDCTLKRMITHGILINKTGERTR